MVTRGSSVTVAPFPPGDGSFHSEYIEGGRVKERCVLDRLQYIFEALSPDTRLERMLMAIIEIHSY